MSGIIGALPIVGWWPEVNVRVPSTQAGIVLTAPTIQITHETITEIGWPELILDMVLLPPIVESASKTTVTIG